jgi:hypothetical protein
MLRILQDLNPTSMGLEDIIIRQLTDDRSELRSIFSDVSKISAMFIVDIALPLSQPCF